MSVSHPSTAGSPRALTPRTCGKLKHCWKSWREQGEAGFVRFSLTVNLPTHLLRETTSGVGRQDLDVVPSRVAFGAPAASVGVYLDVGRPRHTAGAETTNFPGECPQTILPPPSHVHAAVSDATPCQRPHHMSTVAHFCYDTREVVWPSRASRMMLSGGLHMLKNPVPWPQGARCAVSFTF